jgi:hypothetical protein
MSMEEQRVEREEGCFNMVLNNWVFLQKQNPKLYLELYHM